MHCIQKKTFDLILSANCHFLSQVKTNCRRLWEQIALHTALSCPISTCEYYDDAHAHKINRRIELYRNEASLPKGWNGIERLVKVRRWGMRRNKPFDQTAYYVLSKPLYSALTVARAIQGHWGVENKVHWVKDVILGEDDMTLKDANCVAILAYINNAALNILRMQGYKPTKDTFAKFANKVKELNKLFKMKKKK
jgi:predicted transposase YbfD/YdcC